MKIRFYLALAAAALVMTNCSQEEELAQINNGAKGFTASIEGASRSDVTEAGVFSWTAGDAISVYTEADTFDTYANSEADVNTFIADDEENAGTPTGYAIYPAGDGHKVNGETVTINLPENYDYGSTNAPMLAEIEEGSSTLAFKHLGGLMRFVVKNVPTGATSFVFKVTNTRIRGDFDVTDGKIKVDVDTENTANESNNYITIGFDAEDIKESMVFFVPLPVGTYGEYTVAIKGEDVNLSHKSEGVTNTIGRCTMLLMPEFSVENGELKKGAGNVIPVTQNEAANLSGIQNVTIGTDNAGASEELDINYTPSEGNAVLNITDDSGKTESQDSKGKININPQGSEAIESLNLNTPSLTAELGAGKYGTVEALTAKQTLIIGEGVTITKLILNGGALQVAEGATIGEIIVKDEAGLNSAVAAGKATLGADIDLSSTLWIGSDCEIDLNGHYIKCANGTTIKVKSGKKLTIGGDEEGSLVGSTLTNGAAISNLAGTLIIKSGTYQNISSVAPAIFCDRVNENGVRTGTWNLTIEGGTFIGQNFTAVSLQNNRKSENHADYADGKATISGGTFTGGGGYYDLYLANVIADITAGSFTNNKVYLLTQGAAIDGGEGTWGSKINGQEVTTNNGYISFSEAQLNAVVAFGGKAILGADIDLSSTLWIGSDCEIDLNGHYIKCANGTTIKVKSGKKLTIGGDEEGSLVESTLTNGAAISNLAGTLIIKSGTYQNISSVAPAIFCDRVNENGVRTGTWNLTIEGGKFIGKNFTAVSLQNNRKNDEVNYADGKATISGGTFTGGGGYYDLYLANVIADITAGSFTNNKVYLLTQGAAIDGGEGTWSSLINESEISTGGLITIPEKAAE